MASATTPRPVGGENILRGSIREHAVMLLARLASADAEAHERHMDVIDRLAALEDVIDHDQLDALSEAYLGASSGAAEAIARAWIAHAGYSALDAVMDREVWR